MADLEDVTLDGRPLQSLRVADLKAALEERGLSKSGQKNALVKRLKGVSFAVKCSTACRELAWTVRRADALSGEGRQLSVVTPERRSSRIGVDISL